MLKIDNFVTKEHDVFYLDLESYNAESDCPIEDGDMIKFTYDNQRYTGTVVSMGDTKNGVYKIKIKS
jgi:hypothetical protein